MPAWQPGSAARVVIATAWRPELEPYLRAGGRLLFLGEGAGPLRSTSVAHYFNRFCCLHAPEPGHPLLRDLPTDAPGALFFLDLATSRQIDGWEGGVLQRVDCRTCGVNSYLAEYAVGAGRVLHTTLRLHDRAVAEEEIVSYDGPLSGKLTAPAFRRRLRKGGHNRFFCARRCGSALGLIGRLTGPNRKTGQRPTASRPFFAALTE